LESRLASAAASPAVSGAQDRLDPARSARFDGLARRLAIAAAALAAQRRTAGFARILGASKIVRPEIRQRAAIP